MGLSCFDECSKKMVYFALALSDNAIHFRCNAAAAPGVLPRGGGRRSRSHASGSLLYTSFLDHCILVKRNLAIGLTTDRRIKIDCKWKGTRASLDARNVSSGRVLAAAASSSVSEGTVTVEEVPGASPPTTTGGESLVEEENALVWRQQMKKKLLKLLQLTPQQNP
jgi:hypothetical protein